ncbi:MAG: 50S ribosomal protein L30e [Thermoproteales archaeon]|nr:50S ribosomal protein L30e [Thermoproteales archaeon]
MVDFVRELQTSIKSGKVILGSKEVIKALLNGKPKMIIVAANAPRNVRSDIEHFSKFANIPVYVFPGTSWDLGAICNKPFMVSSIAIVDPGESNILDLVKGE